MSGRAVVVAIGNPYRGDDGVGLEVLRAVAPRLAPDVDRFELDGEPARVVDAIAGATTAVIIDAAVSDDPDGTVTVIDTGVVPGPDAAISSHGAGLADALELATALDRLPRHTHVVTVTGSRFELGDSLSDEVAQAVPAVVDVIDDLLSRSEGAARRVDGR